MKITKEWIAGIVVLLALIAGYADHKVQAARVIVRLDALENDKEWKEYVEDRFSQQWCISMGNFEEMRNPNGDHEWSEHLKDCKDAMMN